MERHYQDTLHQRDLMFMTSNARMFNETQKTVIELCKEAKTPGSTDVDLVNVQDAQKFTRHKSLCEGIDSKLIYKEVRDKEEDSSVSSEFRNAIGADPSSKMMIGTA
eukprot:2126063-Ditylum_brightwellii.AAC.1